MPQISCDTGFIKSPSRPNAGRAKGFINTIYLSVPGCFSYIEPEIVLVALTYTFPVVLLSVLLLDFVLHSPDLYYSLFLKTVELMDL